MNICHLATKMGNTTKYIHIYILVIDIHIARSRQWTVQIRHTKVVIIELSERINEEFPSPLRAPSKILIIHNKEYKKPSECTQKANINYQVQYNYFSHEKISIFPTIGMETKAK